MSAEAGGKLDLLIVVGGPAGAAAAFRGREPGVAVHVLDLDDLMKRIRDYSQAAECHSGICGSDPVRIVSGADNGPWLALAAAIGAPRRRLQALSTGATEGRWARLSGTEGVAMSVPLVEQNLFFLRQGAELLRRLPDDAYGPSETRGVRRAGVGPQFRHCLDFYSCLLRDLDKGQVDYDQRGRESTVEGDRDAAMSEVETIIAGLATIAGERIDSPLEVRSDLAPGEEPATAWSTSTVGRELRFLASHTVHHYALIALLLRQRGIEPGEEFGVAPATSAHWRDGESCAR